MAVSSSNADRGSHPYLFSIVLTAVLGGLLFGYDTAVISGAERGLQAFFMGADDFVYTNVLHGITSSSALIGCIIGSALSGFFAGRLGRKKSLFVAGIFFFLSAAGSYYPEFLFFEKGVPCRSLWVAFNLYRVLGGIGVGLASAISPMYIAEVAPAGKRGALVSWNQFAIIFGQLLVYFVNFAILGDHIAPKMESLSSGLNCLPAGRPSSISNMLMPSMPPASIRKPSRTSRNSRPFRKTITQLPDTTSTASSSTTSAVSPKPSRCSDIPSRTHASRICQHSTPLTASSTSSITNTSSTRAWRCIPRLRRSVRSTSPA